MPAAAYARARSSNVLFALPAATLKTSAGSSVQCRTRTAALGVKTVAFLFAQSFRFTPEQAAVLKEEAVRLGSTTTFVRQLLDDYRTLYGLPAVLTEQLDREAAALGKSRREYVIHVLSLRAAQLLKGEIEVPSKASSKSKR